MKIAFNSYFIDGNKAGIGNYSKNLYDAMRKIEPSLEFIEIFNGLKLNKLLFEQIYIPLKLSWHRPDIYYSPSIILPFINFTPSILVVYDLVFKILPEYYRGKINLLYLDLFFGRSLRHARKTITISNSSKNDIVRIYGISEKKIRVIHLAAGPEFRKINDPDMLSQVKGRYRLPEEYILFVGTAEPRKNLKRLIEAYLALTDDIHNRIKLVICGQKGWGYKELIKWLEQQRSRENIIFIDYASAEDLPAIYNMAKLFVYPSLYEGFGLPILEAMACGVPTITSNRSSMPEVAGDGAILIDPDDTEELSRQIRNVFSNEGLALELQQKGFDQAAKFSWEKTARDTLAAIKEVAE